MEKIMRQSGRFSNEGVTVGLQLGLTPPENCEDESIVMKRCDKLNDTFYKNFRTLEGQCNNEEHPLLGSTRSRLSRLLLAHHEKFRKQTFFDMLSLHQNIRHIVHSKKLYRRISTIRYAPIIVGKIEAYL